MPTLNAVDSFGRPNPVALKANGIKLACRYLSYDPSKNINAAELAGLFAQGIGWLANWEADAGAFARGASVGAQHGAEALRQAKALGYPRGHVVYPSCDTDISGPAAEPYMVAFKAAMGGYYGARPYASFRVGEYLVARGIIDAFWQTYAWSGLNLSQHAVLYQYRNGQTLPGVGTAVDFNEIRGATGAWFPGLAPEGGGTPLNPAIPMEEEDMPTIQEIHNDTYGILTSEDVLNRIAQKVMTIILTHPVDARTVDGPPLTESPFPPADTTVQRYIAYSGVKVGEIQVAQAQILAALAGGTPAGPATDTAALLTAIQALPAETVAALKEAL